jgi:hypothetical protein
MSEMNEFALANFVTVRTDPLRIHHRQEQATQKLGIFVSTDGTIGGGVLEKRKRFESADVEDLRAFGGMSSSMNATITKTDTDLASVI